MDHLKLKAEDIEDITVMSAYLQDAVTMIGDIIFQQKSHRFIMMLNRYVWEKECPRTNQMTEDQKSGCYRIRTGLHFDDVIKISSKNIATSLKDHPMELLAVEAAKTKSDYFSVDFTFAGDGIIRLECETISAYMQDMGEPWSAKCHPKHAVLNVLQKDTEGR